MRTLRLPHSISAKGRKRSLASQRKADLRRRALSNVQGIARAPPWTNLGAILLGSPWLAEVQTALGAVIPGALETRDLANCTLLLGGPLSVLKRQSGLDPLRWGEVDGGVEGYVRLITDCRNCSLWRGLAHGR